MAARISDPMVATVLQHAQTTPYDVRSVMHDAWERLATAREAEAEQPGHAWRRDTARPTRGRRAINMSRPLFPGHVFQKMQHVAVELLRVLEEGEMTHLRLEQ